MVKRKGLGRGLDALLGTPTEVASPAQHLDSELITLPVDLCRRGRYQPRSTIDTEGLESLSSSIRAQGVVQPIVVRRLEDRVHYEIIAGERRWRAAQMAGLSEIPAVVRDIPDESALAMSLIENIQRENLNPIDEASALKRLAEEFELTHQQVADAVGRSRAAVSNLIRLLDLNREVREQVERGELEMGHARALLSLDESLQRMAAQEISKRGLSAREAERLVRRLRKADLAPADSNPAPRADPDVTRLERELSERLGARVEIRSRSGGTGSVTLHYTSLDELDGLLGRLR